MTVKLDIARFRGWITKDGSVPEVRTGQLDEFLAEAGQQGWELAGTNFSYHPMLLIFKRPKP